MISRAIKATHLTTPQFIRIAVPVIIVLGIAGAFIATFGFAAESDPPYRWHSSTVTVKDLTANYSSQVASAIDDYDDFTNMSWSASSTGKMIYVEQNLGNTGWMGASISETPAQGGYDACVEYPGLDVTGYCNTTNRKAHRAHLYLNTNYQDDLDEYIHMVVRHEAGHALGMAHEYCGTNSVMITANDCDDIFYILQSDDKIIINSWYSSGN